MSKKAKDRLKLPKQLLGVKFPKKGRKSVNKLLKQLSADDTRPLLATAVAAFGTVLTDHLEQPLKDIADSRQKKSAEAKGKYGTRETH